MKENSRNQIARKNQVFRTTQANDAKVRLQSTPRNVGRRIQNDSSHALLLESGEHEGIFDSATNTRSRRICWIWRVVCIRRANQNRSERCGYWQSIAKVSSVSQLGQSRQHVDLQGGGLRSDNFIHGSHRYALGDMGISWRSSRAQTSRQSREVLLGNMYLFSPEALFIVRAAELKESSPEYRAGEPFTLYLKSCNRCGRYLPVNVQERAGDTQFFKSLCRHAPQAMLS